MYGGVVLLRLKPRLHNVKRCHYEGGVIYKLKTYAKGNDSTQ